MKKQNLSMLSFSGDSFSINTIIRIEEIDQETYLFLNDGTKSKSVLSIDVLEWELPKDIFSRVHPNHLINTNYRKKLFTVHTQWIELENGEKIPIENTLTQNKNLFHQNKSALQWIKEKFSK